MAVYKLALTEQIAFSRQFWHDIDEPCGCASKCGCASRCRDRCREEPRPPPTAKPSHKRVASTSDAQPGVCRNA